MRIEAQPVADSPARVQTQGRLGRALRIAAVVNLAAIAVIGVVFRVARLGSVPGLNSDEYFCLVSFKALVGGDHSHGLFVPTGRVLDLFYAVPAWLIDLVVPRSAATIRLTAMLSGLAMGVASFFLLRRVRSTFVASLVTVVAVITPIQISYSRIGWEYSQVPIACLLIVAAALDKRIWPSAVAMLIGVLVHPAVAYLFPIVAFTGAYKLYMKIQTRDLRSAAKVFGPALAGLAVFPALLWVTIRDIGDQLRTMFGAVSGFLGDTRQMYSFIELYSNLFGTSISEQNLTDAPRIVFDVHNAAFLAVNAFLYGAYFFTFGDRRKRDPNAGRDLCIVIGLLVGIAGYYVTRGPWVITPPYERYSLFLVMPTLIVLALMIESLADTPLRRGFAVGAVIAASWLIVIDFKRDYFDYFEKTGGENAHITYHSNAVDPKVAALDWVRSRNPSPVLYMKEWRTYWPVQYVASADPAVRVVPMTQSLWSGGLSPQEFASFVAAPGSDFAAMLRANKGYVIGFPDGGFDGNIRATLAGAAVQRKDFTDKAGLPVLSVWYVEG